MVDVNMNQLVETARGYNRVPYKWWTPDVEDEQACFCTDRFYTPQELMVRGVNCAALINILYISVFGVPAHGEQMYGTIWWGATLQIRELFREGESYPPGTLLFRRFRDLSDQGHLAMVTRGGMLIHAWSDTGVEEELIDEIHNCDRTRWPTGYFEFAVKPENWLKKTLVPDRWK